MANPSQSGQPELPSIASFVRDAWDAHGGMIRVAALFAFILYMADRVIAGLVAASYGVTS